MCETNEAYVSQKGKLVEAREFRNYRCKDKCYDKISLEERQQEFKRFWKLDNYQTKCLYVSSAVTVGPIKRKRAKTSTKRTNTRIYHLAGKEVCSKMFIQTLRISSARVDRYLKKVGSKEVIKDHRGEKTAIHRKMPKEQKQRIIDHINKFPKYRSHYCRNQSERLFLNSDVTLDIMFNLYKQEHQDTVSFSSYKRIFYDHFNLQRKRLKRTHAINAITLQLKSKLEI